MSALRIVRTRTGPSGSPHRAVLVRVGIGAGRRRALSPVDIARIARVAHLAPAISSYAGRAILDPSLWKVLKHSGMRGGPRTRGGWKVAYAGPENEARRRYELERKAIRQGGLKLTSPAGIEEEHQVLRLGTR